MAALRAPAVQQAAEVSLAVAEFQPPAGAQAAGAWPEPAVPRALAGRLAVVECQEAVAVVMVVRWPATQRTRLPPMLMG